MKFKYGIVALLYPLLSTGQTQSLRIGDKLPQAIFNHVINYPVSEIQLSAFKEKLIILDFFASWCSPCVRGFSKLDSLQVQFKKQLKILLVNSIGSGENEERLIAFFNKRKKPTGESWTFPVIVNDSVLVNFFPHRIVPHYVWIYRGKVVAITSSAGLTATNIKAVLHNRPVNLPVKMDKL